ncbi:MAG: TIGR02186 family protein [Proteobacteria bacterium]|nr:TIGR02186 family protein [Pseudomonadota bacterium]
MRRLLIPLILALWIPAAHTEELTVLMSTQDVAITSTYTGARVTVFGLVERDATAISRGGKYDVVVTVAGPPWPIVVREKEETGPLWINQTLRRYPDVPGYYALLSNGPVATVANEAARERQKMGIQYFLTRASTVQGGEGREEDAARALSRLRKKAELLVEDAKAVHLPRPNIFSAVIPLPATAPTGRYVVSATVLSDGVPLKTTNTSFVVRKIGTEALIAAFARDNGWLYGLITAFSALFIAFAGNMMFRRD